VAVLWIAGLLSESVEVVQHALVDETALSPAERADARLGLGMLAFGQGDYKRAAPALEMAIELYTGLGDARHVATASVPLGVIQAVWDPSGGEALLRRAADTFRELDDQWGLAFASLNLVLLGCCTTVTPMPSRPSKRASSMPAW
jgi:hypothetical protein